MKSNSYLNLNLILLLFFLFFGLTLTSSADEGDDILPGPDRTDWYGSLEACCQHYRGEFEVMDQRLRGFEAYRAQWSADVATTEALVEQRNRTQMESYARYHATESELTEVNSRYSWLRLATSDFATIQNLWNSMSMEIMYPLLAGIRIFDSAIGSARSDALILLSQQIPFFNYTTATDRTQTTAAQWQEFAQELGLAALSIRTTQRQQELQSDPDASWDETQTNPERNEHRPLLLLLANALANGATTMQTQSLNFNSRFSGMVARFEVESADIQARMNSLNPQAETLRATYSADHAQYLNSYNRLVNLRSHNPDLERVSWAAAKEAAYRMWHQWSGRSNHDARCIDHFGDNGSHRCE